MLENYKEFAKQIRIHSLKMVCKAKASHIGGALSMTDLLAVLYENILNVNPKIPEWENRDRFYLSKGHACTSLYSALALKGFFPIDELDSYSMDNSRLLSHASHKVPGVELSTGSLGHALPFACGVALAAKRRNQTFKCYVILSDGELDEGSNWESILFAQHNKLDNLVIIVDYNKIQALGNTSDVCNLDSLKDKFLAFNLDVKEIDGHDFVQIESALMAFKEDFNGKPKVLIANTIKGKGVDFMENTLLWHYKSPSEEDLNNALHQLQ